MKCSNVLAWVSLACAAPTPVIESREIEAVRTIYDSVKDLQHAVELGRNEIEAAKGADQDIFLTASAVKEELEGIILAIIEGVVLVSNQVGTSADSLEWLEELDLEDISYILGSLSLSVQISKDLKAIIDTVSTLSADIRKGLGGKLLLYIDEIEDLVSE